MKNLIFSTFILISIAFLFNCSSNSSSSGSETSDSEAIDDSVVSMPSSLKDSSTQTKGTSSDNSGGLVGVYQGIPKYVAMADRTSALVKKIIVNTMKSGILDKAEKGKIYPVENSTGDQPKRFKVDNSDTAQYENKLSLYFTESGENPEIIARFTVADKGAKGRILFSRDEADETITSVTNKLYLDVTFDGTTSTKAIEIKMIQDISNLIAYAKANPGNKNIDIGKPTKVFLKAEYNESSKVYKIYGTSFHSGWSSMKDLSYTNIMPWDISNRQIYLFKATATDEKAKIYLAFPYNTDQTITGVWDNSSFASVIVPAFKTKFRMMINNVTFSKTEAEFKSIFISYFSGTGITTSDFELTGSTWYLNQTGFDKFLNWMLGASATTDTNWAQFKKMFYSLQAMVNPALFVKVSDGQGQMNGTYDTSASKYYKFTDGMLSLTTIDSTAQDILSLDDIPDSGLYIPNDVVNATITIE